ncbi:unnamed protein product [Pleuronectes platessa]|uniref:Uncharacterized protein n=1 Tax=Pleuronectes platessa TaxID=8262 RepID=A0A9N7TRR4_PLEPL|nr:unnamed protein product [Pleuronectes platessa]
MEEVQALMEQRQQLQTANEQLREQLQNQSQLAEPLPGSSTSSPNVVPEGSLASDAANLRYVYVPRERKCPKFTGKMSVDLLTVEQWIEEGERSSSRRITASLVRELSFSWTAGRCPSAVRRRGPVGGDRLEGYGYGGRRQRL